MPTHLQSMREEVSRKQTASFFTLHNLSADRCDSLYCLSSHLRPPNVASKASVAEKCTVPRGLFRDLGRNMAVVKGLSVISVGL